MAEDTLLIDKWTDDDDFFLKKFLSEESSKGIYPTYERVKKFLEKTTVKKFKKKFADYGWVKDDFILRYSKDYGFEIESC